MKTVKHISLCLILFLPFVGMAQTADVKRANEFFDNFNYPKAIEKYESIQEKEKNLTFDVTRNLAIAYRKVLDFENAEMQYKKVIDWEDKSLIKAEDYYYYSKMLQSNGKYEESVSWMDKFMAMSDNDTRALANKGYSIERIRRLKEDPEKFDIRKTSINSDNDDFGPTYYRDHIIIASNRAAGTAAVKRTYAWDGKPFLNLYIVDVDTTGDLVDIDLFEKQYKSKYHEGPASFSADFNEVFFTQNHLNGKKGKSQQGTNMLTIHTAKMDEEGNWGESTPLEFNSKEYSCGHPALSPDGKLLYFSSDMPGGRGGADIWISERQGDGSWGAPKNAGPMVNTSGNEMFPFVHQNNNLFFASDGHFGLGGLDIFMARSSGNKRFEKAVNLGAPLNGPRDDFSVILNETMDFGYFASNRDTGNTGDDVYKFTYMPKLKMEVVVTDEETKEALDSADVKIIVQDTEELVDSMLTDEKGKAKQDVEEITYMIIVSADEYDTDTVYYTPEFDGAQTLFTVLVPLKPAPLPMFYVGKILDVDPVLFDLDRYNIRPDAALVLDSIVKIMEENPSMKIECMSHTDCRHSAEYNQKLSDKRAESSVKYIVKAGIDAERISGVGYGETMLISDCPCECEQSIQEIGVKEFRNCEDEQVSNCTEDQHQMNRRTQFRIVAF